uniref:GDP-fucose protein O-fucosyltransferase 2-like n=1 Tax=Styela clava TaxID=7725 RepID=UPI001939B660|nr:GDP-fucose protein O-fucosyltransferase 2-like [Styela clava]
MRLIVVWLSSFILVCAENIDENPKRYLLYDCNPGEGFNLRRDVYIRMSNLVKALRDDGKKDQNWVLVLPPWGRIRYHWDEEEMEESKIAWKSFFNVESLSYHVPVMEYEDYVEEIGEPKVDEIWYLQRFKEGWKDGKFEEKIHERECNDPAVYESDNEGKIRGWFWGYFETYATKFKCVSSQGTSKVLIRPLNGGNTTARSVFLDRGETVMHEMFGGKNYWDSRRSMVFAKHLRQEAAEIRKKYLDSDDERDNTYRPEDWRTPKIEPGTAKGGPYIAAHLRRKDFLYARKEKVPSIENTAKKLKELMKKYKVSKVFVASDGTKEEMSELKKLVPEVVMYEGTKEREKRLKKGGVAIVDQIICSYARYFIGTSESTFSFRIQEEREIMGFDRDTTFNRLCGDEEGDDCQQPSRWKIAWESDGEIWEK